MEMSETNKEKSYVPFLRQCFLTTSVALNIVGHGCIIGFSAILIPSLRRPDSHIHATPSEESWIASIVGFALIAGNFIITPMMDTLGRKKSHLLTILPVLVGWFMTILAETVGGLIAARFLQGIAMGMLGPLGSIIIGEMTDPKNRGAFLTGVSLALTIGVMFSHGIGSIVSWQQTALISSFTTFTSLLCIIYTPESPSWLISKGRIKEGSEVFRWLRGQNAEQESELESMIIAQKILRKASIVDENLSFKMRVNNFFRYIGGAFRKPEFYKPVFVMFSMYTMFQFAGINVISSYTMDIIRDVVGKDANAKLLMFALDIERVACNVLAVFLVRMVRRRTMLFTNVVLCILTYVGKGTYVYAVANGIISESKWIPIALIGLYMFSLTVGVSSITFSVSGELFPLAYRGLGGGISVLALSLNFFVAVKSFPMMKEAMGLTVTYYLYACVVAVCGIFIWFLLPETKDKTLQEIEDLFRGSPREDPSEEPLQTKSIRDLNMRRSSSQIIY